MVAEVYIPKALDSQVFKLIFQPSINQLLYQGPKQHVLKEALYRFLYMYWTSPTPHQARFIY